MITDVIKKLVQPERYSISFLLWLYLFGSITNILTNLQSKYLKDEIALPINISLAMLVIFGIIIEDFQKKSRRQKLHSIGLESLINSKFVEKNNYKGLIAFVSEPPKPFTKNQETEAQWFNECKNKIDDLVKNKNITDVVSIQGIGQTFKAVLFHSNTLSHCWFIHSDKSGNNVEIIKYFFKNLTDIEPEFKRIENPNDCKLIKETIDNIYTRLPDGLKVSDIISDITAGNKPMTAGMIISCLPGNRKIEYVEQSDKAALIQIEVSPKFGGVEL